MADVPVQVDLRITLPGETFERVTLALSPTGDLQLVDGREKLVEQILRAVVNDETELAKMINQTSVTNRSLYALFNLILRNFRQIQIDDVKRSDPEFSGFLIYRKAAGTTEQYVKVSPEPIIYKYIDTELTNGTEYAYAVTNVYKNVSESAFTERFSITPSRFSNKQLISVGSRAVVIPGDRQATFYVDYNRKFQASELLDKVINIDVQQGDAEPREFVVNVLVEDLNGNKVGITTKRNTITR
jgi:hypothetical protein